MSRGSKICYFRFGDAEGSDPFVEYPLSTPVAFLPNVQVQLKADLTVWIVTRKPRSYRFLRNAYEVHPGDIDDELQELARNALQRKCIAFIAEAGQTGHGFYALLDAPLS